MLESKDSHFSSQTGNPHFEQKYLWTISFPDDSFEDSFDVFPFSAFVVLIGTSGLRHSRQTVFDLQFGPQMATGSSRIVSPAEMSRAATITFPIFGRDSIRNGQQTSIKNIDKQTSLKNINKQTSLKIINKQTYVKNIIIKTGYIKTTYIINNFVKAYLQLKQSSVTF